MRERRGDRRRRWQTRVTAVCGSGRVQIDTTNVSAGGLRVRGTPANVATLRATEGPVLLQIDLPGDDDPHFCFGETRRHAVGAGFGTAGIEFVLLTEDTRTRLEMFSAGH